MGNAHVRMTPAPIFAAKLFRKGGDMDGDIKRRAYRVERLAKELAPERTGLLKSAIHVDQNRNERGQYGFGYSVKVNLAIAPYARFVIGGTRAFTMPKRSIAEGPYSPGHDVTWHLSPGGPRVGPLSFGPVFIPARKANNFLEHALVAAVG